jgi:Indole-3-glycerol phosphate synthase
MRVTRRLSQAISEGDGISVLVPVRDLGEARAAEQQGAEGVVLLGAVDGVRDAISLPILWGLDGPPEDAERGEADAYVLVVERHADDGSELAARHAAAQGLGLECVLDVRDEDELELALDHVDPEILLLSSRAAPEEQPALERVLDLLPDVPAGKLAIADVAVEDRDEVLALERAGVDAVIVAPGDVAPLVH